MMEYLLKASAITIIFYICYKLLLQRETFFTVNRWFLLIGVIATFLIPLLVIPVYIVESAIPLEFNFTNQTSVFVNEIKPSINYTQIFLVVYSIGLMFFFGRFCLRLLSLIKLISKNTSIKKGKFNLIEMTINNTPFSFFKWIVYNPNLFNEQELVQVVTHEKIHVQQQHSIDNLIVELTTIIFWFNPFIWLYKKEMHQNLEYIADNIVCSKIASKKSYQQLLLKTSITTNQLVLTNTFYNSLIKKRIVMLQKSKSKKINQLKLIAVLPLLALFIFSFNTKVIAQKTESQAIKNGWSTSVGITIDKDTPDSKLEALKSTFKEQYKIDVTYSTERNSKNEIINIKITLKDKSSSLESVQNDNTPIESFEILYDPKSKVMSTMFSKHKAIQPQKNIKIGYPTDINNTGKTPLYILNGKEVTKENLEIITPESIKSTTILKSDEAIKKYGEKGKNGVMEIITTKNNKKTTNLNNVMYILDGIEITKKEMEAIEPNDIHSVNVNKEEEAVLQYGEKAKNSVVIITTKAKNSSKSKNSWKVTSKRNNVIFATKDTIHVNEKPNLLEEMTNSYKNQPLYLLDGKEITKNKLASINQQHINSISSFKGKYAIEKYSDKGKNGVVLIKMKTKNSKSPIVKVVDSKMYFVDGKEIKKNEFENIDQDKIKSVNILKGDEAIKKYGKKAKKGVIEITTKKNK